MTASDELPTNEALALANILAWSETIPAWQRDALRRLCSQRIFSAADVDELVRICRGEAEAKPLAATDIRDPAASGLVVSLDALHSLSNVNALAPGERLTFGQKGLTVIYGDNGAGKSGYARVLKQVCRARAPKGGDSILPNVYGDSAGAPTAKVDFFIGGQKRAVDWLQGEPSDSALTAVSVFDSRTANVHVENTNDLAYMPLPLQMMASLAQACQDVKAKLLAEVKVLEAQTPATLLEPKCVAETAVAKLLSTLSGKTKREAVEDLAGLSAEEEARRQTLISDLGADPARMIRQLQNRSEQLTAFSDAVTGLAVATTDEAVATLRCLEDTRTTARTAALVASQNLFAADPLPQTGSDVWAALWEAARTYSREAAYPSRDFPQTDETAHCVLCQQPLSEAAADRLNRFEAFIQDETQQRQREADESFQRAREEMIAARLTMKDMRSGLSQLAADVASPMLPSALRREIVQLAWRRRVIVRQLGKLVVDLPAHLMPSTAGLDDAVKKIASRVEALRTEESSPQRLEWIQERDGLDARVWLAVVKDDVLAQIKRLNAIEALSRSAKDTATQKITSQSATLAEALVTNRLRGQFALEANKLGIAGLATELRQAKTTAGVPYFQVRLVNKPVESVAKVLSEGEHRCVALAAFLAELSTVDAHSAIVFDDPVCSLDHLHRDKVAARLAEAGQTRQVIVFTHDMAFLLLLDEASRATKERDATPVQFRLISRGPDNAGFCHNNPPASVMPLDRVIGGMRAHLANVRVHHARGDQEKWQREIISFQDQLRTGWERAVEDSLGPVVRRLSRKVDTANLIKITVITESDTVAMRDAYGRCSMLLHSQPGEINPRLPDPDSIGREIDALAEWVSDIRVRQDKAA